MRTLFLATCLTLSSAAYAAPDAHAAGGDHAATEASGDHGDGHGDAHGGDHGEGHGGHHVTYSHDDDHDGTANWLDSDAEGYILPQLGLHSFHLLVLFGVLGFAAGPVVKRALGDRADEIKHALTEAARIRDAAEAEAREIQTRLDALASDMEVMKAEALEEAKAEEGRLIARAQEEASRIADAADKTIAGQVSRAKASLRAEAIELAVQLAEESLKSQVNSDNQQALARQFLASLNGGDAKNV